MKKKIHKIQIFRLVTQIVFLIFFPALFILTFGEIKQVYMMIIQGKFNFVQAFPNLIEMIVIIPLTIFFGRFFCGWMCAFGTMNDLIYLVSSKVFKVKFRVGESLDNALKYVKYLLLAFVIIVMWTMGSHMFDTSSPWDAFAQLPQVSSAVSQYAIGSVLLVLIIIGAAFIERFFCRYLCPLGAVFSIASKLRIFDIDKPRDKCGKCRICTNNCAMGIQLYKSDKVRSGECINCMKCIEACPRKNTQASICDENVNPALGAAIAITAFAGVYSATNLLGNGINIHNKNTSSASASSNISVNKNNLYSDNSTSSNDNSTAQNYKDGTYTGIGEGYRPNLEVSVTVKNSKITNIQILSNNETPRFADAAFNTIPQEIIQAQSADVDAVSGATRSSNGIMMAVQDALSKAQVSTSTNNSAGDSASSAVKGDNSSSTTDNSTTSDGSTAADSSSTAQNADNTVKSSNQSMYKDGTYTGTGIGYRPGLQVGVTIKSGKITDVEILASNDTPRFADQAFNTVPQEIVQAQSANVDAVSGATRSSNGIMMAVQDALSQAQNK